jgi:hypothetical protein
LEPKLPKWPYRKLKRRFASLGSQAIKSQLKLRAVNKFTRTPKSFAHFSQPSKDDILPSKFCTVVFYRFYRYIIFIVGASATRVANPNDLNDITIKTIKDDGVITTSLAY